MNKFQSYLEWLPEKFKEERAKGTLDVKPSQKDEIPKWLKMANDIISRNRFGKELVKKNSDIVVNERLIVTTNDYYVASDTTIHYIMIGKMMIENIIPRNEKTLNEWNDKNPKYIKFLAMQVDFDNEIKLSESYESALDYITPPQYQRQIKEMFKVSFDKLRAKGFKIVLKVIE